MSQCICQYQCIRIVEINYRTSPQSELLIWLISNSDCWCPSIVLCTSTIPIVDIHKDSFLWGSVWNQYDIVLIYELIKDIFLCWSFVFLLKFFMYCRRLIISHLSAYAQCLWSTFTRRTNIFWQVIIETIKLNIETNLASIPNTLMFYGVVDNHNSNWESQHVNCGHLQLVSYHWYHRIVDIHNFNFARHRHRRRNSHIKLHVISSLSNLSGLRITRFCGAS
jgi:hypothetical protein